MALASDTFNRADNATNLGTADVGGTWAYYGATDYRIISNQAARGSGTSNNDVLAVLDVGDGNVTLEADLTLSSNGFAQPGFTLRTTDVNNQFLCALTYRTEAGRERNDVSLYKRVGGTYTQLSLVALSLVPGNTYNLRATFDEDNIKIYVDDVLRIDYTLTAGEFTAFPTTLTQHGLRTYAATNTEDGGSRWDNFTITAVNAGTPFVNGTEYCFNFRVIGDDGPGAQTAVQCATPTAGGNALTETITEAIGVVDTEAHAVSAVAVEPVGLSDVDDVALSGGNALTETVTESIGLADDPVVRHLSDWSNLATATTAALGGLQETVTDPVGLTDAIQIEHAQALSLTDTLGVTDTAVTASTLAAVVVEPLGLLDTAITARQLNVAATDTIGGLDPPVTLALSVAATDPVGLLDTAQTAQAISLVVTDTLGATDTATANAALAAQATDDIGITDTDEVILASAPVLLTPADTASVDLTDGETFTWNHTGPGTQTDFAFRRRALPSGAWEYWNGTGWQASEVFIASTDESVTFGPGEW